MPTRDDPEDDGTRFKSEALSAGSKWLVGPKFLPENESSWLVENFFEKHIDDGTEYVRDSRVVASTFVCSEDLINFDRFSAWPRVINSTMHVLVFIGKWEDQIFHLSYSGIKQKSCVSKSVRGKLFRGKFLNLRMIKSFQRKVEL